VTAGHQTVWNEFFQNKFFFKLYDILGLKANQLNLCLCGHKFDPLSLELKTKSHSVHPQMTGWTHCDVYI
jgi:hypothetical protein